VGLCAFPTNTSGLLTARSSNLLAILSECSSSLRDFAFPTTVLLLPGYLLPVTQNYTTLTTIPESPQLNHQCELLDQKVRGGGTAPTIGGTIGVPTARTSKVAALTGPAQSLMMAMSTNEHVRRRKRREDKEDKSLIKALGPDQQRLFSALATDDLREPSEVRDFMKGILRLRPRQNLGLPILLDYDTT
jgi:hypothetical protein